MCERGSDRATLGLENRCVGARESLCWDDRTVLVLEYHCVATTAPPTLGLDTTRESSVPVSCNVRTCSSGVCVLAWGNLAT